MTDYKSPILRLDEKGGADDHIELSWWHDALYVSIEEPWAGDTHSGFGATTSVTLTVEQAREMFNWLGVKLHTIA